MSGETFAGRARRERALLLAPVLGLLALVVAVPAIRVVLLGFTRTELDDGVVSSWAGLATHARTFADGRFLSALRNTALFTSLSVLLEVTLGTALALLLDRPFRGRGALRAVVLVPWALPTSVMALAWAWIFHDTFGMANDLLLRLGLGADGVAQMFLERALEAPLDRDDHVGGRVVAPGHHELERVRAVRELLDHALVGAFQDPYVRAGRGAAIQTPAAVGV